MTKYRKGDKLTITFELAYDDNDSDDTYIWAVAPEDKDRTVLLDRRVLQYVTSVKHGIKVDDDVVCFPHGRGKVKLIEGGYAFVAFGGGNYQAVPVNDLARAEPLPAQVDLEDYLTTSSDQALANIEKLTETKNPFSNTEPPSQEIEEEAEASQLPDIPSTVEEEQPSLARSEIF